MQGNFLVLKFFAGWCFFLGTFFKRKVFEEICFLRKIFWRNILLKGIILGLFSWKFFSDFERIKIVNGIKLDLIIFFRGFIQLSKGIFSVFRIFFKSLFRLILRDLFHSIKKFCKAYFQSIRLHSRLRIRNYKTNRWALKSFPNEKKHIF